MPAHIEMTISIISSILNTPPGHQPINSCEGALPAGLWYFLRVLLNTTDLNMRVHIMRNLNDSRVECRPCKPIYDNYLFLDTLKLLWMMYNIVVSFWTSWTEMNWNASTISICRFGYAESISCTKLKDNVLYELLLIIFFIELLDFPKFLVLFSMLNF